MRRWMLLFIAMGLGCGSTPATSEPERTAPRTGAAAEEAPPSAPDEAPPSQVEAPPSAQEEAEARARAEAFVRAQGYADTPPTVSEDAIVHEGIEGSLASRLHSLDPHPVSVSRVGTGWGATLRYADPQYAGRGRQLLMPEGEAPHFVHQDMLLPP